MGIYKSILDMPVVDFEGQEMWEAQRDFSVLLSRIKPLPRKLIIETTPSNYDDARLNRMLKTDKT